MFPARWEALNNRGTAHYVSGQMDLALKDYRQALVQVKGSEKKAELIKHNIKLAEEKESGIN